MKKRKAIEAHLAERERQNEKRKREGILRYLAGSPAKYEKEQEMRKQKELREYQQVYGPVYEQSERASNLSHPGSYYNFPYGDTYPPSFYDKFEPINRPKQIMEKDERMKKNEIQNRLTNDYMRPDIEDEDVPVRIILKRKIKTKKRY